MRKILLLLVLLLGNHQGASAQEPAWVNVGVFDLREERRAMFHILNETRSPSYLFMAFFSDERNPSTATGPN